MISPVIVVVPVRMKAWGLGGLTVTIIAISTSRTLRKNGFTCDSGSSGRLAKNFSHVGADPV